MSIEVDNWRIAVLKVRDDYANGIAVVVDDFGTGDRVIYSLMVRGDG